MNIQEKIKTLNICIFATKKLIIQENIHKKNNDSFDDFYIQQYTILIY